MKCRPTCLRTA